MASVYRLAFHRFADDKTDLSLGDQRWSLAGLDPATRVRTGSLTTSDGASLPYRLWTTPAPKGLVLLLHGAFDYSGAFDEIGPSFASEGFHAIAIDQRGFGATRSRGRWAGKKRMMKDVVEAAEYLRKRFGRELPLFVVGESMGASLAVLTAASHSALKANALVLAAPGADSGSIKRSFLVFFFKLMEKFAPNSEIVCERLSGWEYSPGAAIRLLSDPMVMRGIRPGMLLGLHRLSRRAVEAAKHVDTPTLTMVGSKDDLLRGACIARLHSRLAGPKDWRLFEEGPHLLFHWQKGRDVLTQALNWMNSYVPESRDMHA